MTDWETVERLAAELCHMAAGDKLMVAAFNLEAKPADLAEDVRFEVIHRGLL